MLKPNWFDLLYEKPMEDVTAEQALVIISKDPRLIKAITAALANWKSDSMGPSKTQIIRTAITAVLNTEN